MLVSLTVQSLLSNDVSREKQILEITSLFKNLTWKSVTLKSLSSPYVFKKLMAVCASEQSIDVLQQVTSGRSPVAGPPVAGHQWQVTSGRSPVAGPPVAGHQWQVTSGRSTSGGSPVAGHQWQVTSGGSPVAGHQWQVHQWRVTSGGSPVAGHQWQVHQWQVTSGRSTSGGSPVAGHQWQVHQWRVTSGGSPVAGPPVAGPPVAGPPVAGPPVAGHQWRVTSGRSPVAGHQWRVTSGRSPVAGHQWRVTSGRSLTIIILMLHRFLWLWLYQQLPSEPDLLLVCCNIWKHMAHCTEDTAVRHLPTAILKKVAMWSSSRFTSVFSRLW